MFYEQVVGLASSLGLEGPNLPRYRKAPARLESGSLPHRFSNPRDYYRHLYFQTCDLLIRELEDRFDQRKKLAPVLILESIIVNAANVVIRMIISLNSWTAHALQVTLTCLL